MVTSEPPDQRYFIVEALQPAKNDGGLPVVPRDRLPFTGHRELLLLFARNLAESKPKCFLVFARSAMLAGRFWTLLDDVLGSNLKFFLVAGLGGAFLIGESELGFRAGESEPGPSKRHVLQIYSTEAFCRCIVGTGDVRLARRR